MKHLYHFFFSAAFTFCTAFLLPAQTARLYDSGSGLPNTQINDLFQDSRGLVWVATNYGLYSFDGINFMDFHHENGKEKTLASDLVLKVYEDSKGVIWVGTSSGLQIFDPEYNTFTDFQFSENRVSRYIYGLQEVPLENGRSGLLASASQFGIYFIDTETHALDSTRRRKFIEPENSRNINTLFLDSKSRIWASSELGGLFVFNTNGDTVLNGMWEGAGPDLSKKVIAKSITEDPGTGDIIIGTSNYGILTYSENEGRIRLPQDRAAAECKVMSLLSVPQFQAQDRRSVLVGTENQGIKVFYPETGTLTPFSFPNIPYRTDGWKVHKLLEDNQGNLWVSAYQTGLMIVPQSMFGFRYYGFHRSGGPGDDVSCLTSASRDREGRRSWIGSDGNGLFCLSDDGRIVNYNCDNSDLPDDSVTGVAVDRRGTVWVATYLDGICTFTGGSFRPFRDNDRLGTSNVFALVYDEEDDLLYAGTHGGGLAVIDPSEGRLVRMVTENMNRWVNSLTLDRSGSQLWIGTYAGAWEYNTETGKLARADVGIPGINNTRIYSIEEGKDGVIWIGTGEGLVQFDRRADSSRLITEEDGLSSNMISGILEGDDGCIWISTSYGLTRFNPQTWKFSRYYEYDGLQGNEFRGNAVYKSSRGQLFFGGTKGLTSFYPQVVSQKLHDVPPVVFTRLTVANREVEFDASREDNILDKHITNATEIVLPFSSNSFSLEYSVPEFTNPDRIRFAYRLSRFDDDWKTVSPFSRTATYTNLPHGRYRMSVKAYFDGDEDNYSIREVGVRVLPPWYLSFWAFLLYAALAAGTAALAVTLRRKDRLHKQEQKESAMKETKLQMFTDISHEIRTPLNLVMAPLRKLMDSETDPGKKESYALMYRNSQNILLQMNRLEEARRNESEPSPKPRPSETPGAQAEETAEKAFKSRKNLILVDDNAEMRRYLKMELRNFFNIEVCATAEEAWKKIITSIPDAVVTDFITGGEMDGAGLCEKIKHNPSTNLVPVLILSSQWDEDALRKCTESGADRYFVKPVPVDLLRTSIQQAIATRETIRNKYTSDVSYDFNEITIPSSEKQFLPKIIETIKAHISEPDFGVEELSRVIGMSRVHMNRKLKETINISPSSFIKSIRLKQAAYLLVNNKVNISEVAYRVGFSTHSYFSSSFKEYFGLSPKEFVIKYSAPEQQEALNKLLEI